MHHIDFPGRLSLLADLSEGSKTDQNFKERRGKLIAGEINHAETI
jgi:hypothetical protein